MCTYATATLMDSSGVTCHCRAIQNKPSCQSWYTPHVLTHGGQDISTAAISRDAHSWLREEGIWWRFLTDSDRIQGVWRIDAVERKLPQLSICLCRRVPASSSNLSSSPSLDIFVEHIHYIQMIKVTNFRFCELWSTEQNLWWLTVKSNL